MVEPVDWQAVIAQLEREAGEAQNRANELAVSKDYKSAPAFDASADTLRRLARALKAGLRP